MFPIQEPDCKESDGPGPPDARTVSDQLARILDSRLFRGAESQKAFLRYTVEETIAGRECLLKEYTIGVEAFGRGEAFDPRMDPIVRTQARKLRAKLAKYYEGEGAQETLRIDFRKGSYVPAFSTAATPAASLEPQDVSPAYETPLARGPAAWRDAALLPGRGKRAKMLPATALMFALLVALLRWGHAAGWIREVEAHPSVAVMPFANLSDNGEDEFLSDGLTGELIDSLAQTPGLQVIARTSAFRFKGQGLNVSEIGEQLKVRTVLQGSVRRSGDRVKITAQLVNAADGHHLWSGNYDRESRDVRAIEREISQAVRNALSTSLAGVGQNLQITYPKRASPNPSAYQSYLKGRYFWNKLTVESLPMAIEYFEQAISEDPSFAPAYAALADSYVIAPQVAAVPPAEVVSRIRAAASKALALDGSLGEAHIDLAICAEYEFDWETAEREFQKGLELSPGNAVAHLWYAKLLALQGRKQEVLTQRRIAAELDPVSPYAVQAVGGYYSVMGDYDEAIKYFRGALELEPGFGLARQGLGIAYLLKKQPGEAIRELKLANDLMKGPRRVALLGYVYGMSGRTPEAVRTLESLQSMARHEHVPALAMAHVYLGMGQMDQAFEWMEKAILERDLSLTLQWDSLYEPLRADRRYENLLRLMKLR